MMRLSEPMATILFAACVYAWVATISMLLGVALYMWGVLPL